MSVRGVVGKGVIYVGGVYAHLHAHVHVSDVMYTLLGCSGWVSEWVMEGSCVWEGGWLRNSRVGSRRCR